MRAVENLISKIMLKEILRNFQVCMTFYATCLLAFNITCAKEQHHKLFTWINQGWLDLIILSNCMPNQLYSFTMKDIGNMFQVCPQLFQPTTTFATPWCHQWWACTLLIECTLDECPKQVLEGGPLSESWDLETKWMFYLLVT